MIRDENQKYKCLNYDKCENLILYKGRGRKPKRCKSCQVEYSKRLRRDAYRKKVKDKVKVAKCQFEFSDGSICGISVPYMTKQPRHCPKHARQSRLDWMRRYYTGDKIVRCECCGRPMKYETKKPELCTLCRAREKIQTRRQRTLGGIVKDESQDANRNQSQQTEGIIEGNKVEAQAQEEKNRNQDDTTNLL